MYVQHKIEARSLNHCCRGKAISIKYCECFYYCLSYPARKAHAPYYIAICGLSVSFHHNFHLIL